MRTPVGVAVSVLVALAAFQAFAPRHTAPLAPNRIAVERTPFLALARSQVALLAAGELGQVLVSRDEGRTWTRAAIDHDRQALLNQIRFDADGLTGLAVGHEGWILRTTDGGLNWTEVAFQERNGEPLMSVARTPGGRWIAVGAFGRALVSDAEGRQWQPLTLPEGVEDKHLNRIVAGADAQHWMIVGERGLMLRSDDGAQTWRVLPPVYNGSFYNAVGLADGAWLVYGMRGNVFRSPDGVRDWARVPLPVPVAFFGHAVGADGRLVLVGQGSLLATSSDGGRSFQIARAAGRATLTDVLLDGRGGGWLSSDAGLQPLPAPTAPAATTPNKDKAS